MAFFFLLFLFLLALCTIGIGNILPPGKCLVSAPLWSPGSWINAFSVFHWTTLATCSIICTDQSRGVLHSPIWNSFCQAITLVHNWLNFIGVAHSYCLGYFIPRSTSFSISEKKKLNFLVWWIDDRLLKSKGKLSISVSNAVNFQTCSIINLVCGK